MKFAVIITLKKDVLDPQGKVVEQTLQNMGKNTLKNLRQGKYIEIELNESENVDFYIADIDSGVGCAFVNKKSNYKNMKSELINKNYDYFLDNIRKCNLIHPNDLLKIISTFNFDLK